MGRQSGQFPRITIHEDVRDCDVRLIAGQNKVCRRIGCFLVRLHMCKPSFSELNWFSGGPVKMLASTFSKQQDTWKFFLIPCCFFYLTSETSRHKDQLQVRTARLSAITWWVERDIMSIRKTIKRTINTYLVFVFYSTVVDPPLVWPCTPFARQKWSLKRGQVLVRGH